MIFKKNPEIDAIISDFVISAQFESFKAIMENAALNKFSEMQKSAVKTHDEMLADKAILNFYMGFASLLEYQVKTKQDMAKKKQE